MQLVKILCIFLLSDNYHVVQNLQCAVGQDLKWQRPARRTEPSHFLSSGRLAAAISNPLERHLPTPNALNGRFGQCRILEQRHQQNLDTTKPPNPRKGNNLCSG